ncbi:unnamed protein product [Tilletia controversa]|nr:unnamed protein product [Tilletia controversa]CAD6948878.1 unnamed protein product [Tilletia controversa]CAD6952886.1 unnamed protein product [Tilletia controversa]CAD6967085.1 unnamed protein product [Tilletia controversa]CAD6981480.1 unnamed protein product [Tilletia controversa]
MSRSLLKRSLSLNPSPERHLAEAAQVYFRTEILRTDHNQDHPHSSLDSTVTFLPAGPDGSSLEGTTVQINSALTEDSINRCAAHLQAGELVAFPTETVYGLGANALDATAIRKIYAAKRRPADNPLIVHVSDLEMLRDLIPLSEPRRDRTAGQADRTWIGNGGAVYEALIRHFWPGALTLLFSLSDLTSGCGEARVRVPKEVTCGQSTLAIRMPSHPLARALIARTGLPLAAPSANASGRPSPTTAAHVMRDLGGELDGFTTTNAGEGEGDARGRIKYILDGGSADVGVESTVVDGVSSPGELRVLRPGGVTVEQLTACLRENGLLSETGSGGGGAGGEGEGAVRLRVYGKDMARSSEMETNPTTPGMKYRHYSPTAPVILVVTTTNPSDGPESTALLGSRIPSSAPRLDPGRAAVGLARLVRERAADLGSSADGGLVSGRLRSVTIGVMSLVDSGLFEELLSEGSEDGDGRSEARAWLARGKAATSLGPTFTLSDKEHGSGEQGPRRTIRIQPFSLGTGSDLHTAAQRLFEGLRALDEGSDNKDGCLNGGAGCELIVVEALADDGLGLAVMNRLAKAASESVVVRLL